MTESRCRLCLTARLSGDFISLIRRDWRPKCCMLEYWQVVLDASCVSGPGQTPQVSRSLLQAALSWSALALQATQLFVYPLVGLDDFSFAVFSLSVFPFVLILFQRPSNTETSFVTNQGFSHLIHIFVYPPTPPPLIFLFFWCVPWWATTMTLKRQW